MDVWVVISNDFPDAVFDSEVAASAYVKAKREISASQGRRIYWRHSKFTLNQPSTFA